MSPAQPKEDQQSADVVQAPFAWREVLALRDSLHGITASDPSCPHTVEAQTIRSVYERWSNDQAGTRRVCPLRELFYYLRAEYRHLSQQQRTDRLPGLVLGALNDPRGGLIVVPVPDHERRRGDDW